MSLSVTKVICRPFYTLNIKKKTLSSFMIKIKLPQSRRAITTTSAEWKVKSTMQPFSAFDVGTPLSVIQLEYCFEN